MPSTQPGRGELSYCMGTFMRFELCLNTSASAELETKIQIDQPRLWINYISFNTLKDIIHVENLGNTDGYTN